MDRLNSIWETIKEKKHKFDLLVARKMSDWLLIKDKSKPKHFFVFGDPYLGDPKLYELQPRENYWKAIWKQQEMGYLPLNSSYETPSD